MRARANVISVSGGKDSLATLLLALHDPSGDCLPVFADTGNEHEATYEYLSYLEERLGVSIHRLKRDFTPEWARRVAWLKSNAPRKATKKRAAYSEAQIAQVTAVFEGGPTGNPYLDLCIIKGRFPSRMAQFCTKELKTTPLMEYQLTLHDTYVEVWSWQGVRRDESEARRNAQVFETLGGGMFIYRPIVHWTAAGVIAFADLCGVKHNPLYSQGMKRVGCMPCINAGKLEIREIAKRFPAHVERIRAWEAVVSSAAWRGEASFFPDPHRQRHLNKRGITNMIRWAKTKRGGIELDPEADNSPECSSSYGLCDRG